LKSVIARELADSIANFQAMAASETVADRLVAAVNLCTTALRGGGRLLFAGNGGSAADAQHWAGELVSRFYYDRPGLAAIALTTDSSILTAIGNDYGFDYVFARQVEALGQDGDILLAISTSGRSANIRRAMVAARERDMRIIGFTGAAEGGIEMAALCDICFQVPSEATPRIQEGHEFIGHTLCALIESDMHPRMSAHDGG
jgi:D-sedoheptulose 7-phosphate isomerase